MTKLEPGVYQHYKGEYYLLLFVADFWGLEPVEADRTLSVVIDYDAPMQDSGGVPVLRIEDATDDPTVCTMPLVMARAHGRIEPHTDCAVYVPLYSHKPGRRISVRPVSEWTEIVEQDYRNGRRGPRFTYVGQTVPQ